MTLQEWLRQFSRIVPKGEQETYEMIAAAADRIDALEAEVEDWKRRHGTLLAKAQQMLIDAREAGDV